MFMRVVDTLSAMISYNIAKNDCQRCKKDIFNSIIIQFNG